MVKKTEAGRGHTGTWQCLGVLCLFFFCCFAAPRAGGAQWNRLNAVVSLERQSDGIQLTLQNGVMRLQVCTDSIVRVRLFPAASVPAHPDLVVVKDRWAGAHWELQSTDDAIVL